MVQFFEKILQMLLKFLNEKLSEIFSIQISPSQNDIVKFNLNKKYYIHIKKSI
jgi:hypothetical protein